MSRFRKGTEFRASGERPELTVESAVQEFLASHRRKGSGARYLEELTSYLIGGGKRSRWLPLLPWAVAHEVQAVRRALLVCSNADRAYLRRWIMRWVTTYQAHNPRSAAESSYGLVTRICTLNASGSHSSSSLPTAALPQPILPMD